MEQKTAAIYLKNIYLSQGWSIGHRLSNLTKVAIFIAPHISNYNDFIHL